MDKKKKIELASQVQVDELKFWVDEVLDAVGHPEALVTDKSLICDFRPLPGRDNHDEWLDEVRSKLPGIEITHKTYIVVAARLLSKKHKE